MAENPGTESVKDLIESVDKGEYVIPYFQRGYEWQPRMVCDLFESILQDYYAGLILFWELDKEEVESEKWDPVWGAELDGPPDRAILDGQQRLSSLYYAIYNPEKKFPNRKTYYRFFLDLNMVLNEDEKFEESVTYQYYGNYRGWKEVRANREEWIKTGKVPLSILSAPSPDKPDKMYIDSSEFIDWMEGYLDYNEDILPSDVHQMTIYQVLKSILDYNFVFFPLSSDRKLRDICNIFARVNEKGMKLSTFDLMNAFLYPKGVKLRKDLWDNIDNETLKDIDSSMNEHLLRIISLHKQNYSSSKYIYNLVPGETVTRKDKDGNKYTETLIDSGEEFERLWRKSVSYAEEARKIIMNNGDGHFGALKTDFIPNTTMVPVLAAVLWELDGDPDDPEFKEMLKEWYWSSVFSEDYSGSSDSVMSKDFRDWKAWFHGERNIERANKLTTDFIEELDLTSISRGSAQYKAIICIIALNQSKDFYKQMVVGVGDYYGQGINDHHIFPKKVKDIDENKFSKFSEFKDTILNRTLLYDETNQQISDKRPSEYLETMRNKAGSFDKVKEILRNHLINEKAFNYMRQNNFDKFIKEREKTIKKEIRRRAKI